MAIAKEWFQIASTQGYEPSQVKIQQISLLEENTLQKQKEAAAAAAAEQQQQTQEKRSSRWSLGFFRK